MKQISKLEIIKLAKNLMFELDNDQLNELKSEFETILKQMDIVKNINTDSIEPQNFGIYGYFKNFLREDHFENDLIGKESLLKNATDIAGDYILISEPKINIEE